jgi:hypothetical protein
MQVTLAPKTTLGWVRPLDVEFVKRVEAIVPKKDRVLLPSVAMRVADREDWTFAQSTARALPLFTDTQFAFFLSLGGSEFSPSAYMRHVCGSFDIPWLAENGVTWVIMSDGAFRRSCVHNWPLVRDEYYDEVLRMEDRGLYRLRTDRIAKAAEDPRLDLPISAPRNAGAKGKAIRGYVEPHGPNMVTGWACDFGSQAHVTIELELTDRADPSRRFHEFHQAGLPRDARVSQACGGTLDHGFTFAPSTIPRGTYYARVLAYDGPGKEAKLLADDFLLTVPL